MSDGDKKQGLEIRENVRTTGFSTQLGESSVGLIATSAGQALVVSYLVVMGMYMANKTISKIEGE